MPERFTSRRSVTIAATLTIAGLLSAGCSHNGATTVADPTASIPAAATPASRPAQETFATPQAAVDALVGASRGGDSGAMVRLLGPDAQDVVYSGDPVADQNGQQWFVQSYDANHDLVANSDSSEILELGDAHWPMPIPIVRGTDGTWRFDTAAGRDEILNRRIGRNELAAIQVCHAIVDAQQEYAMADPDHDGVPAYAERFSSHAGKKDGLFWPAANGEGPSPLGSLFADAADDGYSTTQTAIGPRRPYHGYFYRILKEQGPGAAGGARDYRVDGHMIGGFGVVAWPADYGNSGVMTFIANQEGVIYQRNFGDQTESIARSMKAFDPTPDWTRSEPAAK